MEKNKFGADLCGPDGAIGGHIYVTETEFTWKPVLWGKSFSFPIEDVIGYVKEGSHLGIQVQGMEEFPTFFTYKGQKIIDAIKEVNPNFRMLASNEYTSRSGCSLIIIAVILSIGGLLAVI